MRLELRIEQGIELGRVVGTHPQSLHHTVQPPNRTGSLGPLLPSGPLQLYFLKCWREELRRAFAESQRTVAQIYEVCDAYGSAMFYVHFHEKCFTQPIEPENCGSHHFVRHFQIDLRWTAQLSGRFRLLAAESRREQLRGVYHHVALLRFSLRQDCYCDPTWLSSESTVFFLFCFVNHHVIYDGNEMS